jgi:tetratricopeptide (TPR) repeat protein/HEAT repeat protein
MRPRLLASVAALVVASSIGAHARADFDPKGKKKKPPVVQPGPGKKPPAGPAGPKPPTGATGATTEPIDLPDGKKDPSRKAAIIALARPGEAGPVLKLAQVYRERDGSLEIGIAEWRDLAAGKATLPVDPSTKKKLDEAEARAREKLADPSASAGDKAQAQKTIDAIAAARTSAAFPKPLPLEGDERWAAQVTLAGLLKSDRRDAEALAAYEAAIAQKPDRPTTWLAVARLKHDTGDLAGANAAYEKALPLEKDKLDRESTLRALMELAVERKDHGAAKKWHEQLVGQNKDSMAVRAELARTYFRSSQFDQAEIEYEAVAKAAAGDNRVYASALLDLGLAQIKLQKYEKAVATLEKGLAIAGAEAGARPRLLNALAEAYRAQEKIEEFVDRLEKQNPADADRQELIGRLAAEFDADRAIKWLSRAVAGAPTRIDARVLLIRLLKEQGKLDDAVKQYELLVQHSKGQPQFVFEFCDVLIGRGERARCLGKLKGLEAKAATDPDIQQRLALYYSQIGEDKLALALMEGLAARNQDDPIYIVDLGDYWYQRGQNAKAKEVWKRLLVVVKPKAKALAMLGATYLEHDLGDDALEAYGQARDLAPTDVPILKGYAEALERMRKYAQAQAVWQGILERKDADKTVRREARKKTVQLWAAQKKLEPQIKVLEAQYKGPPKDVEAGRMLADVLLHLRRHGEAEGILRAIISDAPGDVEARRSLENVLVQRGDIAGAMKIAEELVKADPQGARQTYQRLAQYALQLYRDDEAIRWAAAAVELSPEDASGHQKLGELHRSQQDFGKAIKEFRLAIQHNPKSWPVYFQLGELLLANGEEVEADTLYRRVMRGSGDDELVAKAIHLSAAINQKRGSLEVLETELLPIALGNPTKAVYRRLLVEVYANLTAPLIGQVRAGTASAETIAKLGRIGQRGVQPLIDALGDPDPGQQRTAIEILAFVGNRGAGAPLFAYATGSGDLALRARAMIAAGALRDPSLLPKYEAFLFPKAGPMPKDPVAVAASFGIARIEDRKALPLAQKIVETSEPLPIEMRIHGAVALGRSRDRAFVPTLRALLDRNDGLGHGRAAALWALGEIGDEAARAAIQSVAQASGEPIARSMALLALARTSLPSGGAKGARKTIGAKDPEAAILADGVLDPNERVRRAAALALAALAAGDYRAISDPLPVPDGPPTTDGAITALLPREYGPKEFARALSTFEAPLARAVATALQTSKDRAIVALEALLVGGNGKAAGFGAFVAAGDDASGAARTGAAKIADAAEPFVAGLVRHPDAGVQARAVRWLGRRTSNQARDALIDALSDDDLEVSRLAIEELSRQGDARAIAPLVEVLGRSRNWSVRAEAARAIGEIGKRDPSAPVLPPLASTILGRDGAVADKFAFVREAALRALAATGRSEGKAILERAAKDDPEPRVRETAAKLARGG